MKNIYNVMIFKTNCEKIGYILSGMGVASMVNKVLFWPVEEVVWASIQRVVFWTMEEEVYQGWWGE